MKTDIANWWVMEWSQAGGITLTRVQEALRRNWNIATGKEPPHMSLIVGLFPCLENAEEGRRILKRAIHEVRWGEEEKPET